MPRATKTEPVVASQTISVVVSAAVIVAARFGLELNAADLTIVAVAVVAVAQSAAAWWARRNTTPDVRVEARRTKAGAVRDRAGNRVEVVHADEGEAPPV